MTAHDNTSVEPEKAGAEEPANADAVEPEEDDVDLIERENGEWLGYWIAPLIYLVTPFFIGTFLSPANATLAVLIIIGVGSLVLGLIDGIIFRPSLGYAFACAAMQIIAGWMYYNKGTWLYAVAVFFVVLLGGLLSKPIRRAQRKSADVPSLSADALKASADAPDAGPRA